MTAPAGAFVLRNPVFTLGGTAYANQATKTRLVPDVNMQTLRTLVPDGLVTDVDTAQWTFELSGIADWKTAQGMAKFLHDNHGLVVAVVLTPKPGTGERSAAFSIMAHSVPFGGEQGKWVIFEEEFGVIGAPVFSDSP